MWIFDHVFLGKVALSAAIASIVVALILCYDTGEDNDKPYY